MSLNKKQRGVRREVKNLHSTSLSDILNVGVPETPSGDIGVYFATR